MSTTRVIANHSNVVKLNIHYSVQLCMHRLIIEMKLSIVGRNISLVESNSVSKLIGSVHSKIKHILLITFKRNMAQSSEKSKNSSAFDNMTKCYENYILIDVGANLTNKKFTRDLESVVQRAKDSGVRKIMVTGTSVKGSKEALRLTRMYPETLYSTAGIHPHDAKSFTEIDWQDLRVIAGNQECVAVGECGLDYNRNFSEPKVQRDVFKKHIELAIELNKPLFIHERDAHEDLLKILDEFTGKLPPVLVHCFTGTADQALTYLNRGFYLGLTGYLWKDKSDSGVRKLLMDGSIPLDRLVVETDAPFMYPNTRASKLPVHVKDSLTERSMVFLNRYCTFQRNEPCSLPAIVEMIAAFMQKKPEDVALATSFNAMKLFGLTQ